MSTRRFEIEVNGQTHRVEVAPVPPGADRLRVTVDGTTTTLDVRHVDAHTLSLVDVDVDGERLSRQARFVDGPTRDEVDVHVAGTVVRAAWGRDGVGLGDAPDGDPGGAERVVAPMPGKVVRLLAAVGDEVSARQGVVVVEAMKMENEIAATRAGRVSEIRVEEGASVETGAVLVVIE